MRLALLASVCLLSACQSAYHHDHVGEAAATLHFGSDDLPAQPVICVAGEGFRETRMAVGRDGYKILTDLNEAMKKSPEVSAQIQASASTVEKSRCRTAMRFATEPGQHYRLRLEDNRCAVSVTRQSGDEWQPHPATVADWQCQ